MEEMILSLKKITLNILNSTKETSKKAIHDLFEFYKQFPIASNNLNDVQLSHGLALCERYAAECILDYKRTSSFIKGVYQAINDLLINRKGENVHILYAGCGPYAPLLIPVLDLVRNDQLCVSFIDINKSSIYGLKRIIKTLALQKMVEHIVVADAIKYQHPTKLDLIVTETMFKALTREPQVAITQNLIPQLKQDGILIPQEVSIKLGYSVQRNEPVLECKANIYETKGDLSFKSNYSRDIFKIEKEMNYAKRDDDIFFDSGWINVKNPEKEPTDLCVFTELKVYKEETIVKAESLITNPFCVGSLSNLKEEKSFKLMYIIDKEPKWLVEYK